MRGNNWKARHFNLLCSQQKLQNPHICFSLIRFFYYDSCHPLWILFLYLYRFFPSLTHFLHRFSLFRCLLHFIYCFAHFTIYLRSWGVFPFVCFIVVIWVVFCCCVCTVSHVYFIDCTMMTSVIALFFKENILSVAYFGCRIFWIYFFHVWICKYHLPMTNTNIVKFVKKNPYYLIYRRSFCRRTKAR